MALQARKASIFSSRLELVLFIAVVVAISAAYIGEHDFRITGFVAASGCADLGDESSCTANSCCGWDGYCFAVDSDYDGTPDCNDGCPDDPSKIDPGACGCGMSDDMQGQYCESEQNVCGESNSGTTDCNGICDATVPDAADSDGDGTPDCMDGCPDDPNKIDSGICGCGVSDGDSDGDSTIDCYDSCPNDPSNDVDMDGLCGDVDNCPTDFNPDQTDSDDDASGDVCDADNDNDGILNTADNCPINSNAEQTDSDTDGTGDACDSAINLPETGQKTCWDYDGYTVLCEGTEQDGESRAGFTWPEHRFVRSTNDTITDALTQLIWAKDGNVIQSRNSSWDNDNNAEDGKVTWQHALDYVAMLNAENYSGYNDWRLPNINELASLVNANEPDQYAWLSGQGFTNVAADYYWTSTTSSRQKVRAWVVYMFSGNEGSNAKTYDRYVWPVRGQSSGVTALPKTGKTSCYDTSGIVRSCTGTGEDGEFQTGIAWPSPRFVADDYTITDELTRLEWPIDASSPFVGECSSNSQTWTDALNYIACANANNYLGYNDWRLPNRAELRSLIHYEQPKQYLWLAAQGFSNVQNNFYWTSTTYAYSPSSAWNIDIGAAGHVDSDSKYSYYYVWPVRGGNELIDSDDDDVPDSIDNCPNDANADQSNMDVEPISATSSDEYSGENCIDAVDSDDGYWCAADVLERNTFSCGDTSSAHAFANQNEGTVDDEQISDHWVDAAFNDTVARGVQIWETNGVGSVGFVTRVDVVTPDGTHTVWRRDLDWSDNAICAEKPLSITFNRTVVRNVIVYVDIDTTSTYEEIDKIALQVDENGDACDICIGYDDGGTDTDDDGIVDACDIVKTTNRFDVGSSYDDFMDGVVGDFVPGGNLEIAAIAYSNRPDTLFIFSTEGEQIANFTEISGRALAAGDVDDDDIDEIAFGTESGEVGLIKWNNESQELQVAWAQSGGCAITDVEIADIVPGDAKEVISIDVCRATTVLVLDGLNGDYIGMQYMGGSELAIADVTGAKNVPDGFNDVIATGNFMGVGVWDVLNNYVSTIDESANGYAVWAGNLSGIATTFASNGVTLTRYRESESSSEDLDNDPADIDAFETDNRTIVIAITGVPRTVYGIDFDAETVWEKEISGYYPDYLRSVDLLKHGDVDFDGQVEVIVGSADGKIYVLDAITGDIEQRFGTNSDEAIENIDLADMNGDGTLDIVAEQDGSIHATIVFIQPKGIAGQPPTEENITVQFTAAQTAQGEPAIKVTLTKKIVVNFVMPATETVDLTNVEITSEEGLTVISGLDLPAGVTKSAQVVMPSGSTSVCVDDTDGATLSAHCTDAGEVSVSCPGNANGFTCAVITATLFEISGLTHSTIGSFTPTPATGQGGGGVGGCAFTRYNCTDWSACASGTQQRTCAVRTYTCVNTTQIETQNCTYAAPALPSAPAAPPTAPELPAPSVPSKTVCGNRICETGEESACPTDCALAPWFFFPAAGGDVVALVIGIIVAISLIAVFALIFNRYVSHRGHVHPWYRGP